MDFEKVADLVRQRKEAYQAFRDAEDDRLVVERINAKNNVVSTDEEVAEAKKKSHSLMMVWADTTQPTKDALDEFLAAYGLERRDLYSVCSL